MDINKIILEEIDDFDWIRDIPAGMPLPEEFHYAIELCGTNYTSEDLKDKFIELFGEEVISAENGSRSSNTCINWFNNSTMRDEGYDNVILYLDSSSTNRYGISGGWDLCSDGIEYTARRKAITPQEFLRFVR